MNQKQQELFLQGYEKEVQSSTEEAEYLRYKDEFIVDATILLSINRQLQKERSYVERILPEERLISKKDAINAITALTPYIVCAAGFFNQLGREDLPEAVFDSFLAAVGILILLIYSEEILEDFDVKLHEDFNPFMPMFLKTTDYKQLGADYAIFRRQKLLISRFESLPESLQNTIEL